LISFCGDFAYITQILNKVIQVNTPFQKKGAGIRNDKSIKKKEKEGVKIVKNNH
jgi:hypothetical protein